MLNLRAKRPLIAPQTKHLFDTVRVELGDLPEADPLQTTQPIPLSEAVGKPSLVQRMRRRWRQSPVAQWMTPAGDPLTAWTGMVPVHTARRWLRRISLQAFVIGALAGAAGMVFGYVLVASLTVAVIGDALGVAAHLIGGDA